MKMKRISAAMLAMITALSLSACGTTTESTGTSSEGNSDVQITTKPADTEQAAPADSTTSAVTEATEQTTTATTAPEEPETPVELPVLNVEPTLVMNGCMAFKADGKNYVYNITENEMYETEYDVDDITVIKGCVAVFGDVSPYRFDDIDAYVVNLKTGEQHADVRPFYNSDWNGSYLTVGKLEESFSGNKVSIGMLNSKGEWVLPLSADYAVCKEKDIDKTQYAFQNSEIIDFGNSFFYDIANDKLIDYIGIWSVTDDRILIIDNYDDIKCTYKFYDYDISTGERTYMCESSYPFNAKTPTCHASTEDLDGVRKVFDQKYNLLEHDISEYKIPDGEIRGANEEAIVFNAISEGGGIYTIILNKDGNYVCDPYKYDKKVDGVYNAYFSKSKIVLRYNKINDRIIDINTGEVTEYDDTFDIVDYDTENNFMLVKTNGAYYLVDPENPDVLINPFERASN